MREHQQQEVEPNRCMCNQSVLQKGFFPGTQTFAGEPQKHIEVASRMFRVLKPEIIEKQTNGSPRDLEKCEKGFCPPFPPDVL